MISQFSIYKHSGQLNDISHGGLVVRVVMDCALLGQKRENDIESDNWWWEEDNQYE